MPDSHPDAETPPPRGKLLLAALAGLSLLGGAAGGAAVRLSSHKAEEPSPPPEYAPRHADTPPPLEVLPPAVRLDALIRGASFDEALALCHELAAHDTRVPAYREGICLEGLRRWEEAAAAYRRAEENEGEVAAWCRAVLGRARCEAARGELATARQHLDRAAVRSGHPDCRGRNVLAECLHVRGRLELLGLGARRRPDPLDTDALAWPDLATPPERLPEWLPTHASAESPPAPEVGSGRVEVRRGESHGEPEVTAHLPPRPPLAHIETVATAAGLKVRVEVPGLPAEPVPLDVEAAPLGEVLSALARAGWRIDGDTVVVGPPSKDRVAVAADALRRAVLAAPSHPTAAAAEVALGNLDLEAGRVREAATTYRRLLDAERHTPEALHAAYNLGLVELRQQNLAGARGRFFEVMDRAGEGRWAELGWWWVGRTHLDAGDTARARRPFRNALASKTRAVASAAALGLSACDLLDDDDASARAILEGHRVGPAEDHVAAGELFEALLRYRAAPTPGRAAAVVVAARHADEGRSLGLAGVVLVGTAYRDAGDVNRMIALYEREVESARGPLAARMTFEVAARFDDADMRHEARQRYLIVAAIDPRGLGPTAELRVAALAAREGRGAECVRRCRALLNRDGIERDALLAVLGRGYELLRDHRRAAACFAGEFPAE